ncbi:hypothetical protein [Humibacillus xanthopallidus]|uniref:hypothetical protein n=1 Tax=Humibacillus xanthopallidus TaxID=412689 RepID=UPI0021AB72DF|nr:hypothetical protein [Humibacillus xanthopallidus]
MCENSLGLFDDGSPGEGSRGAIADLRNPEVVGGDQNEGGDVGERLCQRDVVRGEPRLGVEDVDRPDSLTVPAHGVGLNCSVAGCVHLGRQVRPASSQVGATILQHGRAAGHRVGTGPVLFLCLVELQVQSVV